MLSRRQFMVCAGGVAAPALFAADVREPLPDGSAAAGMITPETQRAIDRGLDYLAQEQSRREDGSFGTGQYYGNVAITSLAGLAFMAAGHQPGRGKYGKNVLRALEYVLSQEDGAIPGYLHYLRTRHEHGPMYSHGFAALFLAEVHGMVPDRELRQRVRDLLKRAVNLIITGQNREGGWRYHPGSRDADISVTICQIMALRAARNAGFSVKKETVDRCIEYVKKCQEFDGGFRYMAQGGGAAFARTAAGVVALHSAGVYKGPEVDNGLKYLMRFKPNRQLYYRHDMHYFYGHYYAAQAMWTAGGQYWTDWYPAIREELLGRTRLRDDGSWQDQISPHYGTAMACIILQIPNNYLPILQK